MIQRIQSVYLFGAAVLMILFYIFPIAVFTTDDKYVFEFFNCHITHPENLKPLVALLPLAVLPLIAALVSVVVIFLFKNRKLQMRINKLNVLLVFMVIALVVFYFLRISALLNATVSYGFAIVFPVLSLVLLLMANKAISKDDKLVRAADRIR